MTMKVKTSEPLTIAELINFTGRDALMNTTEGKCRIMNASPNQIIEVNKVLWNSKQNISWGLKEVKGKSYSYLAYKCEVIE